MDLSKGVLIATANKGKIKEIKELFNEVKIITLPDIHEQGFDLEENGETFKDNAFIKAKAYAEKFGYICLADDSGLEVDALDGAPGINSARYAGDNATDQDRVKKLLHELTGLSANKRTAQFRCVVCLYDPNSGDKIFSEGLCKGIVCTTPSGTNGFGYDPIFVPEGFKCTMAELLPEQKNKISHRGRALTSLKEKLLHTK